MTMIKFCVIFKNKIYNKQNKITLKGNIKYASKQ